MIAKQIDTCQRYTPMPISFLINTANSFLCDIYVECNEHQINVKNYDEMLMKLRPRGSSLLFFFNGKDEQAAQQKIEKIFQE